jgi:hypothetical protein
MVSIKELRILLPLTFTEYHRGSIYAYSSMALEKLADGKVMLVVEKRPFEDSRGSGEYAQKMFYIKDDMPSVMRPFLPADASIVRESSWTYYPRYIKESLTRLLFFLALFELTTFTFDFYFLDIIVNTRMTFLVKPFIPKLTPCLWRIRESLKM